VTEPVVVDRPSRLAYCEAIACAVAANNVLPGRPGEPLRIYWLSRAGRVPLSAAAASVVVDRSADVVVLVIVVGASLPFVDGAGWLTALAVSAAGLAALLVAGLIACRWYTQRSRRGRERAETALAHGRGWRRLVSGFVRTASTAAEPRHIVRVLPPTCLAWALWATGAWAAAQALGVSLTPVEALLLGGIVNLGIGIPSSPGFVGTYHWLVVSALGLFAVDPSTAFAYAVALHAIWYVPATLAGLLVMPRIGISLRRLGLRGKATRPRPVRAGEEVGPTPAGS
jgi:hypothetical protein